MTRRLILILNLVTLTSLFCSHDAGRVSSGNRSGVFLLEKKNANPNANGNFRNGVANAIPIRFPGTYGPAVPYTTDRPSRSPSFLNRAVPVPPVPAAPAAPAAGAVVAHIHFSVKGLLEALKVNGKSDSERGRVACWWLLAQLEPVPMLKYAAPEASEDLYRKKPVCTNYAALVVSAAGAGKQYIWHPDPEMTAGTAMMLEGGPPVVPPKQGDADATEEERREFVKSLVKAHCEPLCATFASRGYFILSDLVQHTSLFNEDLPAKNPSGLLDADEGFGKKHSYDWRPSPELSQIEGQAIVSALMQLMKEAHPLKSKSKQRLKKLHQHVFETCCEKSEEAKTREQTCRVEQEKAEQKIYLHRMTFWHDEDEDRTRSGDADDVDEKEAGAEVVGELAGKNQTEQANATAKHHQGTDDGLCC
eukprot:g10738.t1